MNSRWKWLIALRVFLELTGLGFLISLAAFWVLPGARLGLGIADAARHAKVGGEGTSPLSPADLAAILLAVATIVLGVVAFFVSVAAFVGFGEIKGIAKEVASKRAQEAIDHAEQESIRNTNKIDSYIAALEDRFTKLENNVREELDQARGLATGQGADALVSALAGNSPTQTP